MKKPTITDSLTPEQAHYVLAKLVNEKVVSSKDVNAGLARMESEINELEHRLEALKSIRKSAPGAKRTAKAAKSSSGRKRRASPSLSPEVRASRALQGKYISTIKQIPKPQRAKFKKIAESKGREEAIRQMQASLKK